MSVIVLVRHAHADWTPDEDRPLSARGREAAGRVAAILSPRPIRAVYSSPFRRARETVAPLADCLRLPLLVEPDLRERCLGDAPGDFRGAVAATWRDPSFAHPGGESNAAAQARGLAVLRRLRERHASQDIVLATHGNLMALILQRFDPAVNFAFWEALSMPDIYAIRFDRDGEVTLSETLYRP